jgi:6-phosphogluconolactonase
MRSPSARAPTLAGLSLALATILVPLGVCSGTAGDGRTGGGGGSTSASGGASGGTGTGGYGESGGNSTGGGSGTGGQSDTGGSSGTGGSVVGTGGSDGTGGAAGGPVGPGSGATYVFVSGYGGSIRSFVFDKDKGTLAPAKQLDGVSAPSFLAWHSPDSHLYALNETQDGRVQAFSVNAGDGSLSPIDDASSGGAGPAYVLADPTGKWVFTANYDEGTAAVLPVQKGGGLGDPVDTQSFGLDTMPHEIALDPARRFAFVALKGDSSIAQFSLDQASGKLSANNPPRVKVADGVGPRHIAFRPDAKSAYVITEQGSTMIAFSYDAAKGTLSETQTESTRAKGAPGFNITAEVAVHPSGKWLYGSNRSDSNIVQFALDGAGKMTLVGHTDSGGQTPRHFSLDATGDFMFVANEDSDNFLVFRIGDDGKPTPVGNPIAVPGLMPSFVGALEMP